MTRGTVVFFVKSAGMFDGEGACGEQHEKRNDAYESLFEPNGPGVPRVPTKKHKCRIVGRGESVRM
jgi:hypothetical protein